MLLNIVLYRPGVPVRLWEPQPSLLFFCSFQCDVVIMQDIISQFHFLHTHEILYSRQGRQREQDLPFRQLKQLYYKAQHSLHYCAVFNQTLSQRCIRISRLFQGLAAASEHLLLFIFYFFFILGLLKLMGGWRQELMHCRWQQKRLHKIAFGISCAFRLHLINYCCISVIKIVLYLELITVR